MSIVKIGVGKRDNPYSMIDNRPLNDKRLSWKARGLLAYLLSKPVDWEVIITALVKESPGGEESVRSALKELEATGYAKLDTLRCDKGRMSGKRWIILELSTDMAVSPTSGFSSSGQSGTTNERELQTKVSTKKVEEMVSIPLLLNTPEFISAWEQWMTYLKDRRMKPTRQTVEGHLKVLEGYPDPVAAITHSIASQYRKPYPPPSGRANGVAKPKTPVDYKDHGFV